MGHISDSGQIWNTLVLPCYTDHLDQFWSNLVHFGAPHGWPHHPSTTSPDSYSLSSVHLIQKWIILVTQDNFETLILCHAMVTIWVHFGSFWWPSWVTPRPLFIEFPLSHQRYVSYASRAFKCNQPHFPISIHSGDIDLTWALTMGKSGKKWIFRSK